MQLPVKQLTDCSLKRAEFERRKLDYLDAFFELEVQVAKWLTYLGHSEATTPFGQRLKKLVDHPDLKSRASVKQRDRISALSVECAPSLKLRNDLVHSSALVGQIEGEDAAFLQTIVIRIAGSTALVPYRFSEITAQQAEVKRMASWLNLWLGQATKKAA